MGTATHYNEVFCIFLLWRVKHFSCEGAEGEESKQGRASCRLCPVLEDRLHQSHSLFSTSVAIAAKNFRATARRAAIKCGGVAISRKKSVCAAVPLSPRVNSRLDPTFSVDIYFFTVSPVAAMAWLQST